MIIATWSKDFSSLHKGVDAQKVFEEILSIGNSATPEQIVNKGRDETSELHKCFDWNDTTAAEKWREQQARTITHHLVIQRLPENEEKPEIKIFHHTQDSGGYKPIDVIFRCEDEYYSLLQRALNELRAFQRKYSILSDRIELAALIDAVETMSKMA